jgi:hypothetical protein
MAAQCGLSRIPKLPAQVGLSQRPTSKRADDHSIEGHREQVEHARAYAQHLTLGYRCLDGNHVRVLPQFSSGNPN